MFVGNYYLLKNQPETALKWYDEAELPKPSRSNQLHLTLSHLYRAIALRRLGRDDEAVVAETSFEAAARAVFGGGDDSEDPPHALSPEEQRDRREVIALQRELLVVEAYASIDDLESCERRLRQGRADESIFGAFAREIALGQVLLLRGDKAGFVELVSSGLLQKAVVVQGSRPVSLQSVSLGNPAVAVVQLSFWPLLCEDFYDDVPDRQSRQLVDAIAAVRKSDNEAGKPLDLSSRVD